jgi:BirA family transcriptional regulator, biotin operon repressor / biotin---[acetyl-CoA-carboxylase] ligase
MTLSHEQLQLALPKRPFRYFASVDSTNDLAMSWLKEGAGSGSVVIADEQLKGRGRMGRVWHTPPSVALALSVILKPLLAHASKVSLLGGLCVAQLCEELGAEKVGIKWPNDVQIDGRKVCGVLPEAVWHNDQLLGVVLGMGVNVRVNFEGELANTAISLETVLQRRLDRTHVIACLLGYVDEWAQQLDSDEFLQAWKARLVMLGKRVTIGNLTGIAMDVDEHGALLLQTDDGQLERVIAGDIQVTA